MSQDIQHALFIIRAAVAAGQYPPRDPEKLLEWVRSASARYP